MNRHRVHAFLAGCLLAASLPTQASTGGGQADAVVERVQMPAWVERQGTRQELSPGVVLQNRDRVITGATARVRIRLADGSVVALGADTILQLNALGVREGDIFTAALDVPQGALRFTTGADARSRQRRAINLRIGTITAGLRGTDLWGSADGERDRICLLQGSITVVHPQQEAQQINEPLRCYVAPKDASPIPLEIVTGQQVSLWTGLTAIPGDALARAPTSERAAARRGRWGIELATLDSEADALALYDRAREAGYDARIKPQANSGGGYRYSVRISRLAAGVDATTLSQELAASLQVPLSVSGRH